MKKFLLIIPAILLLAAACSQQAGVQQNTQTSNPPAQQQTTQTPTPTNETAAWKIYTNTRFGFQLTFTDAWKSYKVFSSEGSQGVGAPTDLEFSLLTTDKSRSVINVTDNISGYASPLTITIIAKDRNYQGTGVKITQDNNNSYYYTINKDLPKDLQGLNFEVPKIISTFKFTGQSATPSDQTSTWNTCLDNSSGLQFRYPASWYIWNSQHTGGDPVLVSSCSGDITNLSYSASDSYDPDIIKPGFSVDSNQGSVGAGPGQRLYGVKTIDQATSILAKSGISVIKKYTVAGEQMYELKTDGSRDFMMVHNGIVYEVYATNLDEATLLKIFSTFKFTK